VKVEHQTGFAQPEHKFRKCFPPETLRRPQSDANEQHPDLARLPGDALVVACQNGKQICALV